MTVRGKQVPRWLQIAVAITILAGAATTMGVVTPGWATKDELVAVDQKADAAMACCEDQIEESVANTREILRRLESIGGK